MEKHEGPNHHHHDGCCMSNTTAVQSLDELDFERGLWTAAINGNLEKAKHLLERGISVDIRDHYGYTPLHYAAHAGKVEMCQFLISHHANVNAKTISSGGKKYSLPLHMAAYTGRVDVCRLLLEKGALVNELDSDGRTALHKAYEGGGHADIIQLLKHHGVDEAVLDSKGCLATDYMKKQST